MRITKAPELRRQEILETAMVLFTERGYEETSMRDIAQACHVVPGLCYRYFDSKQALFQEAMDAYVEACCGMIAPVLRDPALSLEHKLDRLYQAIRGERQEMRYHDFLHRRGNEGFHEQFSVRLCGRMVPRLLEALHQEEARTGRRFRDPETLISFVTYGQIALMSDPRMPREEILDRIRSYIDLLLASQME
ncbi:TetR/AcrR family transcriptional regulator [uncultured Oscillibacter sp.]|uniref:TetR/AcrR family transcriptional regulator n=1 Tax=uncultured Oscillibacter sp. TaxID=876091 RepID=UPI0025F467C3|nr:TetR/AcrR family transcriptional regulator [uncultured Oscillibacter sp.]